MVLPGLLLLLGLAAADPSADRFPREPILMIDAGGHSAGVAEMVFTNDGKQLVTVSPDKTIRIWDVRTATTTRVLRPPIGHGHEGELFCVALSPDGRTIATAGYNAPGRQWGRIHLIDVDSGTIRRVLVGHVDSIGALAFSLDGQRLASVSRDKLGLIWDVSTGRLLQTLRGHSGFVVDVAFSPDGRKVATASFDKTARIWSADDGRELATLSGHSDRLLCLDWSPDGRTIATSGFDRTLILWNADGSHRWRSADLGNEVPALKFTPDSRQVLLGRGGPTKRFDCSFLDLSTGRETVRFNRHDNSVGSVAISPDGRLAASFGGNRSELYLWRTSDGVVEGQIEARGARIFAAGWSPDGQSIAWGNTNVVGGHSLLATHPLEASFRVSSLSFGPVPDSGYVKGYGSIGAESIGALGDKPPAFDAVGSYWNGRTLATFKLPRDFDRVNALTMFSAGRAVVGSYESLYLVDTRSGRQIREFSGQNGAIFATAPSPDRRYFLTGSSDRTLRIWDPERDEPVLSLFVAGPDWIAWTPEGYFASSPGGERLIGWHVNRGPAEMGEFHPASHFRATLYRPDVIRRILETGRLARALDQADRALGRQSKPTKVAEVLPPRVAIVSPGQRTARVDSRTIEIQASAESVGDHPVTSLQLLINDRPYEGRGGVKGVENPRRGKVEKRWVVELDIGKNRLAVLAESDASRSVSEPIDVIFLGERGRPAPARPRPKLHVLAIGVADYPGPLKLNYAAADARKVADAFRDGNRGLFAEVVVKHLGDREATREAILRSLTWLKQSMTRGDVGVIFFSGHGQQDREGNLFLLPIDIDPTDLFATGVPSDQIRSRLAGIPGQVVALLDACHSGAVGKLGDLVSSLSREECGVWVLASSRGDEASLENHAVRQGNFTQALVEGLSGKADPFGRGEVLISDIQSYVYQRVVELSRDRQHPVYAVPGMAQPFALVRSDRRAERESTADRSPAFPIRRSLR